MTIRLLSHGAWASLEAVGSNVEHRGDTPDRVSQAADRRDDCRGPHGQRADGDRSDAGAEIQNSRRDHEAIQAVDHLPGMEKMSPRAKR